MSFVLSLYTEHIYREVFLPELDNADHVLHLHAGDYALKEDILLQMEVLDGQWSFKSLPQGRILWTGTPWEGKPIRSGQLLNIITAQDETIAITVWDKPVRIAAYPKYAVIDAEYIRIGRGGDNDIVCTGQKAVSDRHAEIRFRSGRAFVQDFSANGTYLAGRRITGQTELKFGDTVNILGLTITYLEGILVVNSLSGGVQIRPERLYQLHDAAAELPDLSGIDPSCGENLVRIAPRTLQPIFEEPEKIENIPQKREMDQKPAWMSILPSLTMVLPMILGFTLMGNGMGSGLVIALGSAVVGFSWAVINLRYNRKKQREQELLRLNKYGDYLVQCADRIREKFEHNRTVRDKQYPPASVCAQYSERSLELWARTKYHSDFLFVRLGLGDMPFQVKISAPQREFSLMEDELSERPGKIANSFQMMKDVPVGVDLVQNRVIGLLSSDPDKRRNLMRILVTQITANHCYTDVKLVFLYNSDAADAACWDFAKWLPHVWNEERTMRYISSSVKEENEVLYPLVQTLRTRAEQSGSVAGKPQRYSPHYVVIAEDPSLLDGQSVSKFLFETEGDGLGVTTILMAGQFSDLPNACRIVVTDDGDFAGMFGVGEQDTSRTAIAFDIISQEKLMAMAKRMTPMRVKELESSSNIPSSLTYFEMMGVQRLDELQIMERWRKNRTYESMRAMVGFKAGNVPCYLDIYEKVHGPHGLVAGTTGSGKSETLQTYILSLACNFSPQDVGFFIIDFKGGGMANLFSNLPHMMGQISNLSGNQVRRAMVSIKSENARRMRLFGEHGVNKIDDYTKLYKNQEAATPIPHLLIIIDEFAELKREEPEFMKELISVAQVGRSLGVHLILATQKPSGTVDDNIWSNSKFKLCLRVADKQDSNDMLHKPDAAYLTQAGRCFLQVGNDEIFELFQSGWSGAMYDPSGEPQSTDAVILDLQGRRAVVGNRAKSRRKINATRQWMNDVAQCVLEELQAQQADRAALVRNVIARLNAAEERYPDSTFNRKRIEDVLAVWPERETQSAEIADQLIERFRATGKKLPEPKELTQLDAVVDYLDEVAKKHGLQNKQKLWLPVLPEAIYLENLEGYTDTSYRGSNWPARPAGFHMEAYLGLVDAPEAQRQFPLVVDLATGGHMAVVGGVTSGKSTLLQTLVYSLISSHSPDELNLYLVDFSSQMLAPFEKAPHVGGVVFEGEDDRLNKLFGLLGGMLAERKQLLRGGSFSQYVQVNGYQLPAVVLVIDGYATFREKTDNRFEGNLMELLRDAEGYGIYVVISCNGFGGGELQNKLADKMRQGLCLELGDKFKYAEVLHTSRFDVLPETNTKGRGLAMVDENVLEYQAALAVPAENDYKRSEAIDAFCCAANDVWTGRKARRIPEIPKKPSWELFAKSENYSVARDNPALLPVAYRQEDASAYCIDLSHTFCYLVLGTEQSGKSVFLRNAACAARDKGGRVYLVDREDGSEEITAKQTGAVHITSDKDLRDMVRELILLTNERGGLRKQMQIAGCEEDEIFRAMQKYPQVYFLVADLENFLRRIYGNLAGSAAPNATIENIISKGKLLNVYFIAAVNMAQTTPLLARPVYPSFIRDRRGILLGGALNKQTVFAYQNIPYSAQGRELRVGQGYAVNSEEPREMDLVIIPQNRGL